MIKAYGYLRVSGKSQVTGDGPERQEHAIRAYAAMHDIEIVRIYFERGVCGEVETMERPEFMAMMADIGDDVITVIVERLDRLSRHLITQETCIQDFARKGYTLLSADSAEFDLMANDPGRVLVRQVFGAIAQYDKAMIVSKLMAARRRKKLATGRCEGQLPFGARPGEQAIVGQMKALRIEGHSFEAIANIFNAERVPTRNHGAKWYAKTVQRILVMSQSTESDKSILSERLAVEVNAQSFIPGQATGALDDSSGNLA